MNTAVIHRYKILALGLNSIQLPTGAKVVNAVPSRSGGINLFASHVEVGADETRLTTLRHFVLFKTGTSCPAALFEDQGHYITTVGPLHLYECSLNVATAFTVLYPTIVESDADAVIAGNEG